MKKVVVYALTRNVYYKLIPSLNSLLINGKIDRVYVLAEDDDLGFELPENVYVINISGQEFFPESGPNYHCRWTYMTLMRCALTKIFPNLNRVMYLDFDTIVFQDLSELWEIDLTDYYVAGVREVDFDDGTFGINAGAIIMNLAKLRADKKDDEIINLINTKHLDFPDQNAISDSYRGQIYELPHKYNSNLWAGIVDDPAIRHFAAEPGWYDWAADVNMYRKINDGKVFGI